MAQQFYLPEAGDVIAGRFRILREIGRGGFGVVFAAEQLPMGREIAVKMLLPQAAMRYGLIERFEREAQLVKNLIHPNTIRIYDSGRSGGGLLFIAMEYLHGTTLSQVVRSEGAFNDERAFRVISQVLKSLVEAHEHGIIHRDMKPANIMLVSIPGEIDFIKVLDFGIAKAVSGAMDIGSLTITGQGYGTPRYMAPELLRGEDSCPQSDLYAIGLILVELLLGRPAIGGETPAAHASVQLSPDPHVFPAVVYRSKFAQVITKATAKPIYERYHSAPEFLRALSEAYYGTVSQTTGPPPQNPDSIETMEVDLDSISSSSKMNGSQPLSGPFFSNVGNAHQPWDTASSPLAVDAFMPARPEVLDGDHTVLNITPSGSVSVLISPTQLTKNRRWWIASASLALISVAGVVLALATRSSPGSNAANTTKESPTEGERHHTIDEEPAHYFEGVGGMYLSAVAPYVQQLSHFRTTLDERRRSATIQVTITSEPSGATIYDGKHMVGVTPYKHDFPVDFTQPIRWKLRLKGHNTSTLVIQPAKQTDYHVALKPKSRRTDNGHETDKSKPNSDRTKEKTAPDESAKDDTNDLRLPTW